MSNEQLGNRNYVDLDKNKFVLNKSELDEWSPEGMNCINEGIEKLNTAIDNEIKESKVLLFGSAKENAAFFARKYESMLENTIKSADSSAEVKDEINRIVATLDATPNVFRNPSNMRMFLMDVGLSN